MACPRILRDHLISAVVLLAWAAMLNVRVATFEQASERVGLFNVCVDAGRYGAPVAIARAEFR
jgi:hypothetical protein